MYIRRLYNFSLRSNKAASLIRYDLFARICGISEANADEKIDEKIDDKTDGKADDKTDGKVREKAKEKVGENADDY